MSGLTIAQLSDVHLGFDRTAHRERNEDRLHAALAAVAALEPNLLIITGDLTEDGAARDYERLRSAIASFPCPVRLTVGNHDVRANFLAAFPDTASAHGFVQFCIDLPGLRCIVLDTLLEERHGGDFCAVRAQWLAERLAEDAAIPTLILLHHPPAATGIAWMDPNPAAAWITRLADAVRGRSNVIGLTSGHIHRASVTAWHGIPLITCPSVAPALALSFAAIDPASPDDRAMVVDDPPGFVVHRWDGTRLTTHFGSAGGTVLARFDERLQPMVREMVAEREGG
ncbi:MAG: metallophosphoesterase [Pseudomonadota bacterium]